MIGVLLYPNFFVKKSKELLQIIVGKFKKYPYVVYICTAFISIMSWVHVMFFAEDPDFLPIIFFPLLFIATIYLIVGLLLFWKSKNSENSEITGSGRQERFSNFYPIFLVLTIILLLVAIPTFSGSLHRYGFYFDKFLVWFFYNF